MHHHKKNSLFKICSIGILLLGVLGYFAYGKNDKDSRESEDITQKYVGEIIELTDDKNKGKNTEDTFIHHGWQYDESCNKSSKKIQAKNILKGHQAIKVNGDGILPIDLILEASNAKGNAKNIKVCFSKNTKFKKKDNKAYTGIIYPPITSSEPFISTGTITTETGATGAIDTENTLITFKIGSDTESIQLSTLTGGTGTATIMVPIPYVYVGAKIWISYSENDRDRYYLSTTTGTIIDGQSYIIFETPHFTTFTLGFGTGVFNIDNDQATTDSLNVTLNSNVPNATEMKFGNSIAERDSSNWIPYNASYPRTLNTGGNGTRTVYSMFRNSSDGSTGEVIDTINYNANGTNQGDISLTIGSGTSYCIYGLTIDLGTKGIDSSFGGLIFTGNFLTNSGSNTRSCTDFAGTPSGRDLTIQTSNLTNESNNTIDATNVLISHTAPVLTAGNCITGGAAATDTAINTPHTILAKSATPNRTICRISTSNVNLKVNVAANQAPGRYIGTLTITLPTFN